MSGNAAGASFKTGGPFTTDNDASCDISVAPAATLLLPYFEVSIAAPAETRQTTIFTITNTSQLPQIARVTLWTNLAYPVFTFNIYLTGYDVQSVNLHDVLVRGQIGNGVSPVGVLSSAEWKGPAYDNPVIDEPSCANLPVQVTEAVIARMKSAFTAGVIAGADGKECRNAGLPASNAVGYATIDVVGRCDSTMPDDAAYFEHDIRYDNVLIGDYHQLDQREDFAQGSPMVHIRAMPEGGSPGTRVHDPAVASNLPRTFYGAYQSAARPALDARQPLPSLFAARWVEGGRNGFETFYKIWREPLAKPGSCKATPVYDHNILEAVRFDEEENPETIQPDCYTLCPSPYIWMPSASLIDVSSYHNLPPNSQDACGGWMYLNLDKLRQGNAARQGWVVASMRAEDRFSIDLDAAYLGNGCSAPVPMSEATDGSIAPIGPAPNRRP